MIVQPFTESDAYKLGIIDAEGKNLIPATDLKSDKEKDAYSYLTRLVFNMKKILGRIPGGDARLKNMVAALYLIREQYNSRTDIDTITEEEFRRIVDLNIILAEESLQVKLFMEEGEGGGAIAGQGQVTPATSGPTNVSKPADGSESKVSTDIPMKRLKKEIARRAPIKLTTVDLNQRAL
jgi:hypothetical protein